MRRTLVAVMVAGLLLVGMPQGAGAGQRDTADLVAYLYATAPYPDWQYQVIWCESRWEPWVTSWAGAQGLAQFMPETFEWASAYYGIPGSPYDPYVAMDLMNALFADGYASWWDCA